MTRDMLLISNMSQDLFSFLFCLMHAVTLSDSSCFGHYNRSCLLTYLLIVST